MDEEEDYIYDGGYFDGVTVDGVVIKDTAFHQFIYLDFTKMRWYERLYQLLRLIVRGKARFRL